MNRNSWIVGIIVVILVVIGIWYFAGSGNMGASGGNATSSATTTGATTGATGSASGATASTNSFRSIFAHAENTECTYDAVGATTAHNIIRIADGKMYGEFRTSTASGSVGNFMIYSDGSLFVWREGATIGEKTTIRSIADLPDAIPSDLASDAILGASGSHNVGWNCHPWAKDTKQFTLPTYVTFS